MGSGRKQTHSAEAEVLGEDVAWVPRSNSSAGSCSVRAGGRSGEVVAACHVEAGTCHWALGGRPKPWVVRYVQRSCGVGVVVEAHVMEAAMNLLDPQGLHRRRRRHHHHRHPCSCNQPDLCAHEAVHTVVDMSVKSRSLLVLLNVHIGISAAFR